MLKYPLTFPVVFHGLFEGRIRVTRVDSVNLLLFGDGLTPEDDVNDNISEIGGDRVSKFVNGGSDVSRVICAKFLFHSEEEIIRRVKKLDVDRIDAVVKEFHCFLQERIVLETNSLEKLNDSIEHEEYEQYIARALRIALSKRVSDQERKLPSELINELHDLSKFREASISPVHSNTYSNLPFRNALFVGRVDELKEIKENFEAGWRIQMLQGMGGFGKTRLALEYAYQHKSDYSVILFVDAGSVDKIAETYRKYLIYRGLSSGEKEDRSVTIDRFRNEMEKNADWLIIYDNCDYNAREFGDFLNCVPDPSIGGHIMITGRYDPTRSDLKMIAVNVLSPEESKEFLLKRTGLKNSDGLDQLVDHLGNHPLALEMAGAYIQSVPGMTFAAYDECLRKNISLLNSEISTITHEKTIRGILLTTLDKIKADRNHDPLSRLLPDILGLCSLMPYYDVDLKLLRYLTPDTASLSSGESPVYLYRFCDEDEKRRQIADLLRDDLMMKDLSGILVRYSLVRVLDDVEKENLFKENGPYHMAGTRDDIYFSMHPLQQEVIRFLVFDESSDKSHAKHLKVQNAIALTAAVHSEKYIDIYGTKVRKHLLLNMVDSIRISAVWRNAADNLYESMLLQCAYLAADEIDENLDREEHYMVYEKNETFTERIRSQWHSSTILNWLCGYWTDTDWYCFVKDRELWEKGRSEEMSPERSWLSHLWKSVLTDMVWDSESIKQTKSAACLLLRNLLVPSEALKPYPEGMEIPSCLGLKRYSWTFRSEIDAFIFHWVDDGGFFSDPDPVGKRFVFRQEDGIVFNFCYREGLETLKMGEYGSLQGTGYLSEYMHAKDVSLEINRIDKDNQVFRITEGISPYYADGVPLEEFSKNPRWKPFFGYMNDRIKKVDALIDENFRKTYPDLMQKRIEKEEALRKEKEEYQAEMDKMNDELYEEFCRIDAEYREKSQSEGEQP